MLHDNSTYSWTDENGDMNLITRPPTGDARDIKDYNRLDLVPEGFGAGKKSKIWSYKLFFEIQPLSMRLILGKNRSRFNPENRCGKKTHFKMNAVSQSSDIFSGSQPHQYRKDRFCTQRFFNKFEKAPDYLLNRPGIVL